MAANVTRAGRAPAARALLTRDRAADLVWVMLAVAGGAIQLITLVGEHGAGWIPGPAAVGFAVDSGIGALAAALLLLRRRWPVGVAVAMVVPMILARSTAVAMVLSVFNVALRRRAWTAVAVAALHQVAFIGFILLWIDYPLWAAFLWVLGYHVACVSAGQYFRARRLLVASLHDQVRQAEATTHLMAEQARQTERARIAVEMHDVLAHRVSLMALQAGALEIRPDLPADEVRQTAGLIRSTARQTLSELRDVIGVLHDDQTETPVEAALAPQPRLRDIPRLVAEYREAGLRVELDVRVDALEEAPESLGRDAYRIVREALANVTKHARSTAATVSLSGRAGEGLRVTVRNKLPVPTAAPDLPGAGAGLVGLAERVALAGGTLTHGPEDGDFVLDASLRWEA